MTALGIAINWADAARTTYESVERNAGIHLARLGNAAFDEFTIQEWAHMHGSHADDIVSYWPDGRIVKGVKEHVNDLIAMFAFAPDTRIKTRTVSWNESSPSRTSTGHWTTVINVVEGAFTEPMLLADGQEILPTGRAFKFRMCTVGHWKDGVMDAEYLFWSHQRHMRQLSFV